MSEALDLNKVPPKILSGPKDCTIKKGERLCLRCTYEGTSPLKTVWRKGRIEVRLWCNDIVYARSRPRCLFLDHQLKFVPNHDNWRVVWVGHRFMQGGQLWMLYSTTEQRMWGWPVCGQCTGFRWVRYCIDRGRLDGNNLIIWSRCSWSSWDFVYRGSTRKGDYCFLVWLLLRWGEPSDRVQIRDD